MIVRSHNIPVVANEFEGIVCWMDEKKPLNFTTHYLLQHTSRVVKAYVQNVHYKIDVNTLHRQEANTLSLNEMGRVQIKTGQNLFFDSYKTNRKTGSFILIDPATYQTVAAGMVRTDSRTGVELREFDETFEDDSTGTTSLDDGTRGTAFFDGQPGGPSRSGSPSRPGAPSGTAGGGVDTPSHPGIPGAARRFTRRTGRRATNIQWEEGGVSREEREAQNGHKAAVLWFTGLSGSGKSTIAKMLEKVLFDQRVQVMRLDGDNVRHGLCSDLGFSQKERHENIRRIAHISHLFFETGNIVLCSFISPEGEMRDYARSLLPEGRFIEIHVDCPVDICRERDPKGLYRKADSGEIKQFTGVSAPYETPDNPELTLHTDNTPAEECVHQLLDYLAPFLQPAIDEK